MPSKITAAEVRSYAPVDPFFKGISFAELLISFPRMKRKKRISVPQSGRCTLLNRPGDPRARIVFAGGWESLLLKSAKRGSLMTE